MKLGIVGAGFIVSELLTFIHDVKGIELIAISATERSREKLENIKNEHGFRYTYTDYDEMLKNDEIDTVYIAVPNHLHYEYTKKALLSGKHVINEKPFTVDDTEAKELFEIAEKRKLILVEAMTTRFQPNFYKVKELVEKLGSVRIVTCNYSQYSSRYNRFKEGVIAPAFDPNCAGGALLDLNIYNLNFVVALFGKPLKVNYEANIVRDIDTSGICTLDYGTFKCVCVAAKDSISPLLSTIQGDEGYIICTTPLSMIDNYAYISNRDSKRLAAMDDNQLSNDNGGYFRMYHEFIEFERMIRESDFDRMAELKQLTIELMEVLTDARRSASIVFPFEKG